MGSGGAAQPLCAPNTVKKTIAVYPCLRQNQALVKLVISLNMANVVIGYMIKRPSAEFTKVINYCPIKAKSKGGREASHLWVVLANILSLALCGSRNFLGSLLGLTFGCLALRQLVEKAGLSDGPPFLRPAYLLPSAKGIGNLGVEFAGRSFFMSSGNWLTCLQPCFYKTPITKGG